MEFPALLSVLLNEDCSAHIAKEEPRLRTLASTNGTNLALEMYLNCYAKTGACPSANDLLSYAANAEASTAATIQFDVEAAQTYRTATVESFPIAFTRTWQDAATAYAQEGFRVANAITVGLVPPNYKKFQFDRRMEELFGENRDKWDRVAFAQIWHDEHRAANPFVKREEVEEELTDANEYSLAKTTRHDEESTTELTLHAIKATDVKPEAVRWLWQERIPYGKITLLSGKPECGKTMAMIDLCARVSAGREWPDGSPNLWGPKKVLLACSEDGLGDTIRPRLDAAGANLENISFITTVVEEVRDGKGIKLRRQLKLDTDLSLLRKTLTNDPELALVALDPATSFFGDVNINVDKDVRPVMDTLAAICNAAGVSFVTVIHHNKRNDVDALQKILGASSLAGSVRAIWGFSEDQDKKDEYFMSRVKGNLSKKKTGMKYTIEEKSVNGIEAPYIAWGEQHDQSANDLLTKERETIGAKRGGGSQLATAKMLIPALLKDGPKRATELFEEAEKQGVSINTMYKAKSEIGGVLDVKRGITFDDPGRYSWWKLAKPEVVVTDENVV
jgi:hypothetical protein